MAAVAIVGAGDLGGSIAATLARRHRIGEIRLIDPSGGAAAGKALDIQQAGPIEASDCRVVSSADVATAVGAAVIVLADLAGSPCTEWQGEAALALLKRLAYLDGDAVFVCAGVSAHEFIERGVRELKVPRARLVGSAPEAVTSAVRAMVAIEAPGSPADVSVSVLGTPPGGLVVSWTEATIGGRALTGVLDTPQLARIAARASQLWPLGPYALASAASRVSEAVVLGSRRLFSCTLVVDGEFAMRGRATTLPVMLGPRGVERIIVPSLSARERVLVENAMAARSAAAP